MTGNLQPLDQKFPIVTPDGRPTLYFIKWAQQKQIDIGAGITAEQALQIIELYLADHQLQEGSGISISPSGNLSDAPTIAAEVQVILDQITNVHGSVLFRGAAGWEALGPGTAGRFLKTNGAGADPEWAAGGGGGGGNWWFDPPTAAEFTQATGGAHGWASLTDDADEGLLFDAGTPFSGDDSIYAYKAIATPGANWQVTMKARPLIQTTNYSAFGLLVQNSANSRIQGIYFANGSEAWSLKHLRLTPSSFSSETVISMNGDVSWVRLARVGGNLQAYASADGKAWALHSTVTIASWLVNDPDRVGFGVLYNRGSGMNVVGSIQNWTQSW